NDVLTCGYLGDDVTLNYYRAKLSEAKPRLVTARSLALDIAERSDRFRGAVRVSVPPARVQEFVADAHLQHWVADPVFGIVLCDSENLPSIRVAAAAVGGSVVSPA